MLPAPRPADNRKRPPPHLHFRVMPALSLTTAGESHGPCLIARLDGLPAGLPVDLDFINAELLRRQGGAGRGGRQRLESDHALFLAGVRRNTTTGAPVIIQIPNRDSRLDDETKTPALHRPRPGHADLAGSVKWLTDDCRDTLERASARETAARVAAGALARLLLRTFAIEAFGFVRSIHDVDAPEHPVTPDALPALRAARDASPVYALDPAAGETMVAAIRAAAAAKDTVGGIVETHILGLPIGLGSCMNWFDKLDSRIAAAVMGTQAFKGVEIGLGFAAARRRGSEVHDPIAFDPARTDTPALGFSRSSNNAGGLEGGMTNGAPLVVRAAMKPISTVGKGMPSVDLRTREAATSQYERSDICAVSAASVVIENVVAFEVARAFCDKFAGDSLTEVAAGYDAFLRLARNITPPQHPQ